MALARFHDVPGVINFRGIGGYPIASQRAKNYTPVLSTDLQRPQKSLNQVVP